MIMNNSQEQTHPNSRGIQLLEELRSILQSPQTPIPVLISGEHGRRPILPIATPSTQVQVGGHQHTSEVQSGISALSQFRRDLPDGSAFRGRASDIDRSVRNEITASFSPYPRNQAAGPSRSTARITGARNLLQRRRQWVHAVYCLAGPSDSSTPLQQRKIQLAENGLGANVLKLDYQSSTEQIQEAVYDLYVNMRGRNFECMKPVGGGDGKPLVRIVSDKGIPSVEDMSVLMVRKIIYIRPLEEIVLEMDENQPTPNNLTTPPNNEVTPQASSSSGGFPWIDTIDRTFSGGAARTESVEAISTGGARIESIEAISTGGARIESIEEPHSFLTISEFRDSLYLSNEGFQPVFVQRDDFVMQVLGVYKSSCFNLLKKPQVIFAGEAGTDAGALMKEYFWEGIAALRNGKFNGQIPIFEGEDDHKLPTCDISLLRSGIFKCVGKFIVHGAIHLGLGFFGLSPAVVEYISNSEIDDETPFTITVEDIPDVEFRQSVLLLDEWISTGSIDKGSLDQLWIAAQQCDFNDRVNEESRHFLRQHLLYHSVIAKRKPYLDSIKLAFSESPLLEFISGKEYIINGIFPRMTDMVANPELVMSKIKCESISVLNYAREFILSQCKDPARLQRLLCAWTGWALLPDDDLEINIVDTGVFIFHACFHQLDVPVEYSKEQLFEKLELAINFGSAGFGAM